MKSIILSSLVKVFSDEAPVGKIDKLSILKNEYGAFQLAFCDTSEGTYTVKVDTDLCISAFSVEEIPATKVCGDNADDYFLRKEPGMYPDLLKPFDSVSVKANEWKSIWFEIAANDYAAGTRKVTVSLIKDGKTVSSGSVEIEVIDATMPEQTLICTNWYHTDCICNYYKIEAFSEEYWRIVENFAKAAVSHGINFLLTPLFTPPLDTQIGGERRTIQLVDVTKEDDGTYTFGFDKLDRWIEMCDRCGVKYFEMSHLFTQWGAMHAPKIVATVNGKEKKIFGWGTWAASKKYTEFLRAFAEKLNSYMDKKGITNRCIFHVSDEPNMLRLKEYAARSALIKEIFPNCRIIDALSDIAFYEKGCLENPIPCINHTLDFVGKVPELWTYYCCGPSGGYHSNRFFAMPSQRTRVLGYQMYKYDVKGFLQWGLNFWNTQLSVSEIDPFLVSDAGAAFPAGDAYVLYPGEGGEALVSLRFKIFREAIQDQRALNLLESLCGREKAIEILEDGTDGITFSQYPRDDDWLLNKREQINAAIKDALK
ncbi:MAG: DUF4091 domain-containing protein [Clostridia bacterium]|nr:DUF4091 domain-containing protein [Clostridia bacterium]